MAQVLVTGASKGIGRQLVKQLLLSGHDVWAVARSTELLQQLSSELNTPQFHFSTCDVGVIADWEKLKTEMGRVKFNPSMLFLNAGGTFNTEAENNSVNFEGVKNGWATFNAGLLLTGGTVVVTGSLFAFLCPPFQQSYSMAKYRAYVFLKELMEQPENKRVQFKYIVLGPVNSGPGAFANAGWRSWFIPPAAKAATYILNQLGDRRFIHIFPFSSKVLLLVHKVLPKPVSNCILKLLRRV
ncbi:MAG TPA: SDR family NAD(P)-dependent oxidoreductase [Chitinophagales bacterium]|nr:SDR family NAD(P)-dependent oxidoreductase [Chitinophagales bacterium]